MSADATPQPTVLEPVFTQVQVRFSDTDAMGHISSGSYAAWAEVGRHDFFANVPRPVPWFVLVHLGLDFHKEGKYGMQFEIETKLAKLGNRSITLQQLVRGNGELVCSLKIVMAGFDRDTRQAIAIPSWWRLPDIEPRA